MPEVRPLCIYDGECGARRDGRCDLLTDVNFKDGECHFQSPQLPSTVSEIKRMYNSGIILTDISSFVGIKYSTVSKIIRDEIEKGNLKTRQKRVSEDNLQIARKMLERGASCREIGKKVGYSANTVSVWHMKGWI